MYKSIYELEEKEIHKLLENNDVNFSNLDKLSKLKLLESLSIFKVFIPNVKSTKPTSTKSTKKSPLLKTHSTKKLVSRATQSTNVQPFKSSGTVHENNNITIEDYTRLVSTNNGHLSDLTVSSAGIDTDLHIGDKIQFSNFEVSATSHTIVVEQPQTVIKIPKNRREITVLIRDSIETVVHFTFESEDHSSHVVPVKMILINDSQNSTYFGRAKLCDPSSLAYQMLYVIYGNVHLGHKSALPYELFTDKDKLSILSLRKLFMYFINWKSYVSKSYDLIEYDFDISNKNSIDLDISKFHNFAVKLITTESTVPEITINFIDENKLEDFGHVILINTCNDDIDFKLDYKSETLETNTVSKLKNSLINYTTCSGELIIDSTSSVDLGGKYEVTMTIKKSLIHSESSVFSFWIQNSDSTTQNHFEKSTYVTESEGKLMIDSSNMNSLETVTWFLDPSEKFILRTIQNSGSGDIVFHMKIGSKMLPVSRGQYLVPSETINEEIYFYMKPVYESYITDMIFHTYIYSRGPILDEKPLFESPELPSEATELHKGATLLTYRKYDSEKNILDPFKIQPKIGNDGEEYDYIISDEGIYITDDTTIEFSNDLSAELPVLKSEDLFQMKIYYRNSESTFEKIFNCKYDNTKSTGKIFCNIPISQQNTFITRIEFFNKGICQNRFKFSASSNIGTLLLKHNLTDEIVFFAKYEIDKYIVTKNTINYAIINFSPNSIHIVCDLCPGATYSWTIHDSDGKNIPITIFKKNSNKQEEYWLNSIHIFENMKKIGNDIILDTSEFTFIPLRYNSKNIMFPDEIEMNSVNYSKTTNYKVGNKEYLNIFEYSDGTSTKYMKIDKTLKQTTIQIGNSISDNLNVTFTNDFVDKYVKAELYIPQSLSFGSLQTIINCFKNDTSYFQFINNTMIISGHVASISTNEHQSLFSSENNKFILSVPSIHWSTFVDALYTDENVRSVLKGYYPKQEILTGYSGGEVYRLLAFSNKTKSLRFSKGDEPVNRWALKHDITKSIISSSDNRYQTTKAKTIIPSSYEYSSSAIYYEKFVLLEEGTNFISNFNANEDSSNSVKLKFIAYLEKSEYIKTNIQFIEPIDQDAASSVQRYGDFFIQNYQTTYNISVTDIVSDQEVNLYHINDGLNDVYFYDFSDILDQTDNSNDSTFKTIAKMLSFSLCIYPVGKDNETTLGHKYIQTDKGIHKIQYYNFPYDVLLQDKVNDDVFDLYIENIQEVVVDFVKLSEIRVNVDVIYPFSEFPSNISLMYTDISNEPQNIFVHSHNFVTQIDDFRPSINSKGIEIIPRRLEYNTVSNPFSEILSTTDPIVSDYETRKLFNFKLTAPHFNKDWSINTAEYVLCLPKHDILKEFDITNDDFEKLNQKEDIVLINLESELELTFEQIKGLVENMRNSGIYIEDKVKILRQGIDYSISTVSDTIYGEMLEFKLSNLTFSTISTTILPTVSLLANLYIAPEETTPENPIVYNVQCLLTDNIISIVDGKFEFNGIPYDSIGGIGVSAGLYNFYFENGEIQYPIGFVIDDPDTIDIRGGTLAGISRIDEKNIMHYYDTTYVGQGVPVTIEVKKNFGSISLHSLRNGYMGYNHNVSGQKGFHFVSSCPAPVPALGIKSITNTTHFTQGFIYSRDFYIMPNISQPVRDNKRNIFEIVIEHKKGIMEIADVKIIILQAREDELQGSYYDDYAFLENLISQRFYLEFSFVNDYSSVNDISKVFNRFYNGIEVIYVSDTLLKLVIDVNLNKYLYDHTISKLIPYVYVNYDRTPTRLDSEFTNYNILDVNSNEVAYKVFDGSYMYISNLFIQVDDMEWSWDHSNSLILPEGTVNSFYILIENQGYKDGVFSITFTKPELNGKTLDIPLKNNVGFTVMLFKDYTDEFNTNSPGAVTHVLSSPPTDGVLILSVKARETCAIQYTILQLPEHLPGQDYKQYFKVTDITDFGGTPTFLS